MAIRDRLSGNEAIAYAIKQINPDVMPAFPITPSTEIPQYVATYIANGEIDTKRGKSNRNHPIFFLKALTQNGSPCGNFL